MLLLCWPGFAFFYFPVYRFTLQANGRYLCDRQGLYKQEKYFSITSVLRKLVEVQCHDNSISLCEKSISVTGLFTVCVCVCLAC